MLYDINWHKLQFGFSHYDEKYHTLRTVPKFHSEYRGENEYPNTNIYMRVRLLPYLGTVTSKNI